MTPPPWDLLTLGEALLRLTPPGFEALERAPRLEASIAGSELNVACALARLGRRVSWASRLPLGPLGRRVAATAREQGVDVSAVQWVENERLGVMYFEPGLNPRASRVTYDRRASSAAGLSAQTPPWSDLALNARYLHLTGITAALGPGPRELVLTLARRAAEAGARVSFDLNYRAALGPPQAAAAVLQDIAPSLDTLIVAERDARAVLGLDEEGEALARALRERYGARVIALTRGPDAPESSLVLAGDALHRGPRVPVTVLDRLGAGDAFAAGLLHGLLNDDPAAGARAGAFMAAVALATPGDICLITPQELAAFEAGETGGLKR